jgi:heme/copper-type cytochrome/quinol oxidase subunit 2
MLAPGLIVWNQFITVPADAASVEVVSQQWLWSFRLPGADGKLGRAETRDVTPENPLGLDKNDASGLDDVIIEGGELHLPIGKPVHILLRSVDVLHDFYVPEFRAKMDMIPGMITYFWFTPTRTGTFEILCAELCGVGHPQMRGTVVVDNDADYQTWLGQQQTFTQLTASSGELPPANRPEAAYRFKEPEKQLQTAWEREERSWSRFHPAASHPPKSRMSSFITRTAGGPNMCSARTPRSSPCNIRSRPSRSAWWRWCSPG